jgi:diguanylate cyclase (GGDEF)-like protein
MDGERLLQRRLEREKLARKAAEAFVENKRLELHHEQQKRDQAFEALRTQVESSREVNAELQREFDRRIRAETLEKLLERIVHGQPLPAILAELARLVERKTSSGRCYITTRLDHTLFHAAMPSPAPVAAPTLPAAGPAQPGVALEPPGDRHVQLVDDLSRDPVWRPHWEAGALPGLHSGWTLPLVTAGGQHVGDFAVHHPEHRAPAPADLEWMLMLGDLAALAIEHRWLADRLAHQAHYDALTDLPNRALFRDRLDQAIAQARRDLTHIGVLFLDLDGFKHINDTLGHQQGDQVLLEVTRRIQALLREQDTLARMGGDEFMVILPGLKKPGHAARVAEKCVHAIRAPMRLGGHELRVSSSIGISIFPEDAQDAELLQRNADLAMYLAKAHGKNGFEFFTRNLTTESVEWLDLRSDLHHALEHGQLSLHYQPQFRMDGSVLGLEALLRWQHPTLGLVPPAKFIPIAEETGLILPIGTWVLREACRQMAAWRAAGHDGLTVAVNVSAVQLERDDLVDTVALTLMQTGLPPALLELELTESLLMWDIRQTTLRMGQLRRLGVQLAVDDFGTGYSSLQYLQQLPINTIKIDRTFINDIDHSLASGAYCPIIRTIIDLGRSLGLRLIAEGVETEPQAALLRELGCDGMQGYLFTRPMPAADCEALLQRHASATGSCA